MIALKINNTFLNLTKSVNINMSNPIFDKDGIARVFSYPFILDPTPTNVKALKYPTRVDAKGFGQFDDAVMYLGGNQYEHGRLEITGLSSKAIKVVFKNQPLSAIDELESISLNEILDTIDIPQPIEGFYVLKVLPNFQYYSLNINDSPIIVNPTISGLGSLSEIAQHIVTTINNPYYVLATAEYIAPDKFKVVNDNNRLDIEFFPGLEIADSKPVSEARGENMLVFADEVARFQHTQIALPMIYNTEFYGEANSLYGHFINYWREGDQITPAWHSEEIWRHTYIPFLKFTYLLEKIATAAGFSGTTGDFITNSDISQLCLYNNYALDQVEQRVNVASGATEYLNGFKPEINLNDHAPEMSGSDFLNAFTEFFNIYTEIKDNRICFKKKVDQLRHKAIDWTKKSEPDYSRTINNKDGITFSFETDNDDTFYIVGQLAPKTVGNGEEPIKVKFKPLHDNDLVVFDNQSGANTTFTIRLPTLKQKGSSDELGLGKNETALRVLFDRGLKPDSQGRFYPMGQHGSKDINGDLAGLLSLDWNAEDGIYEQNWKEFASLLNADTFDKIILIDIIDIFILRKWENSRRRVWSPDGIISGVIKNVQFQADPNSKSDKVLAKVTFASEL